MTWPRLLLVAAARSAARRTLLRCGGAVIRRAVGGDVRGEVGQQEAELGEVLGAESLFPCALGFADDVAHRTRCSLAARGERNAREPLVAGSGAALEVTEALELLDRRG